FQDFRLRLDQHFMVAYLALAFLLLPGKNRMMRGLICAMYLLIGLMKLHLPWLTGQIIAPYHPFFIQGQPWITLACSYVAVLELVFIWGLFSKKGWIRWSVWL